jgi:hypothetical protein
MLIITSVAQLPDDEIVTVLIKFATTAYMPDSLIVRMLDANVPHEGLAPVMLTWVCTPFDKGCGEGSEYAAVLDVDGNVGIVTPTQFAPPVSGSEVLLSTELSHQLPKVAEEISAPIGYPPIAAESAEFQPTGPPT